MANGISVQIEESGGTGTVIETAATARSAMAFAGSARACYVYDSYSKEIDKSDE